MTIILGKDDIAKYPFLNEAAIYIKETHFDLNEFDRPEFGHVIDRAQERIESAIFQGKIFSNLEKYDVELFTFLISLIMIKHINIEHILKKFSLFEAMRAEKFLVRDLNLNKDYKRKYELISKIFIDVFKLKMDLDQKTSLFKISVPDYIKRAVLFHEQEWKLINRSVSNGLVYLDTDETVRLIRNELSKLIYNRIKSMNIPFIPEKIRDRSSYLKGKTVSYKPKNYIVTEYPPCIKHAYDLLKNGENLPHSARFMLATYMLAIGKSVEEIVTLFSTAPDYNEKITRYQVEHLAGEKGSHTKYSVPSCSKLSNENLCYANSKCLGIMNPVQYGRIKKLVDDNKNTDKKRI
ncbi:MAG: DNA primase [Nitrososphaeraceae archaeon]